MIDITTLDVNILGHHTPDPLGSAFNPKQQPHVHSGGRPLSTEVADMQLMQLLQQTTLTDPDRERCLYLHIPFCRVRCTYCPFFQHAASAVLVAEYLALLVEEIEEKAALPWSQLAPFSAVYIGGGTPSDLTPEQIARLINLIRSRFPLTADCEITLEGRLNRFSDEKYMAAVESGVNRFSFGVQSFDTSVRRMAKRLDDRETLMATLNRLVSFDRAAIVIDLLFGLPGQDSECWQRDLNDFLTSGAHGVDLYQLLDLPGTPMARLVDESRLPAPASSREKAYMFAQGVDLFADQGLQRLSANHWGRDPRERSRYNHLAKTCADVLPLGAGAGGSIAGYSLMQIRDLDNYRLARSEGRFALQVMAPPAAAYIQHAAVKSAFDRGEFSRRSLDKQAQSSLFSHLTPLLQAWEQRGLLEMNADEVALTTAGAFWNTTLARGALSALQQYPLDNTA